MISVIGILGTTGEFLLVRPPGVLERWGPVSLWWCSYLAVLCGLRRVELRVVRSGDGAMDLAWLEVELSYAMLEQHMSSPEQLPNRSVPRWQSVRISILAIDRRCPSRRRGRSILAAKCLLKILGWGLVSGSSLLFTYHLL